MTKIDIIRTIQKKKLVEERVDFYSFLFKKELSEDIRQDVIQIIYLNLWKSPHLERYWAQGEKAFGHILYMFVKSEFMHHKNWRPFLEKIYQFSALSNKNVELATDFFDEDYGLKADLIQEVTPLEEFNEFLKDVERILTKEEYKLLHTYYTSGCQYTKTSKLVGMTSKEVKEKLQPIFEKIKLNINK